MSKFRYFQHTDMSIAVVDASVADRIRHYEIDPQYVEVAIRTIEEVEIEALTTVIYAATQRLSLEVDLNDAADIARGLHGRGIRPRTTGER